MARALLARPIAILECQNGSSHAIMARLGTIYTGVPEWLEPFWYGQLQYLSARMARAILVRLGTILECQNGSSHSGMASCNTQVPEWLEPFRHGQLQLILEYGSSHSGTNWPCQNGSSHFSTPI